MRHHTADLAAPDARLFRQAWLPDGDPDLVLAVVHGYGEHAGRLVNLVAAVVPCGFAVHAYDLRGHGRSGGPRGHVARFERYLTDTESFLGAVTREHPGKPLFLLGHSFGGLVASLHAEGLGAGRRESGKAQGTGVEGVFGLIPAGVILSSPFLALGAPVSRVKLAGARLLSVVAPRHDIGNTLLASDLSHDPAVVAAYTADPLNHHVATARWAVETLAAQRRALDGASRLRLPLLVLYGGEDAIAAPAATRRLFEGAGSRDKVCLAYEGYYHELFNEVGRQRPLADLVNWLLARI